MTNMLREIHEQPEILEKLIGEELSNAESLCGLMRARGIEYVSIAARGTSDNAATFGKYLLEIAGGVVVSLAAPSVFTLYDSKFDLSKWVFLGISQSGESPDVIEVMRRARDMGALTAGITNVADSPISAAADFTLLCHAGDEKSVAATKTYMATLGVLYLMASLSARRPRMLDDLKSAAAAIRSVFDIEDRIAALVERYRYMDECMVIARGINQATCQEAALKLSETCYVVAKPYSGADFLHGPIATIDDGFPVFLFAPRGPGYSSLVELTERLKDLRAETVIISDEDEILSMATTPIKLPVHIDELYSPLVYIVVGQLFAQYLSLTKGYNPDHPRGLSKVTRTL
jgi:glucosamine--fructose-6-phosphate aminotransferase (isomerizing)